MAATNLLVDLANKKAVVGLSDPNPIVPPDVSVPGNYDFNVYYLNFASPYTYHRYPTATNELNIRQAGPPTSGTFKISFLGYTTDPIDIDATLDEVQTAIESLRSIGKGNIQVDGNRRDGWVFEFIGNRAGLIQTAITADVTGTLELSEAVIDPIKTGGINGQNAKQRLRVRQKPVATTRNFVELTAGAAYGWSTIGGSPLNTAVIPTGFWNQPIYDIVLELKLFVNGARSGADGVTTQIAGRSGSDGVIADDGRGRSGTDGVATSSSGRSGNGYGWNSAPTTLYFIFTGKPNGTPFTSDDIGRTITDSAGHIPSGTVIVSLHTNSVTLSKAMTGISSSSSNPTTINWTTGGLVNATYQASSGNFSQADVGHIITGTNIPSGTTIQSVTDSTHIVLSQVPTSGGTSLPWTITAQIPNNFSSASANFTQADVGRAISGTNIPVGATISTVVNSTQITLSISPLVTGTGLSWAIASSMSKTYQSATASFAGGDVGRSIIGDNIPGGTTIASVTDATHAVLSNFPTAVGTGLAWTIVNLTAAAPTVTDIQVGTSSLPAIQQVTFAQVPAFGTFNLQDGAGGSQPLVLIEAPLDANLIQSALNQAYPAKGPFTVTSISSSIIQITWGVTGAQSHILVDDTNLIYDHQAVSILLVPGIGEQGIILIGGFPNIIDGNIAYFGDVQRAYPCGELLYDSISDGTGAVRYRQRFTQLKGFFARQTLNSGGPNGSYLISEENMEDRNGMLLWDRVWATLPASRSEVHQQSRTNIGIGRTYLNGILIDIQLFSVSIGTWVRADYTYYLGHPGGRGVPADGPAGTVLHFQGGGLGISVLLAYNGFDTINGTFYRQFVQGWARRRWLGNIWEQVVFIN